MLKTQIIELAQKLTGYAGDTVDNLVPVLDERIRRFCLSHHFDWRKRTAYFNTVAGTASYDLMDESGANARDIDEIQGVWIIDGTDNPPRLDPLTGDEKQIFALESTDRAQPSLYFRDLTGEWNLRLFDIPDKAYKVRLAYWAIPNPAYESSDDSVALVPSRFHFALVSGLKMDIREIQVGVDSPKYLAAKALYEQDVAEVKAKSRFTTEVVDSMAANDQVTG